MNKENMKKTLKNSEAILKEIRNDWRSYCTGVGNCYPPDQTQYGDFFDRMVANIQDIEDFLNIKD